MANNIEDFSETELNSKFHDLISKQKYQKVTSQEIPNATVLGGLAGSGKSNYIKDLKNTYAIIGDDYRNMHPRFNEIVKAYGDDWVLKTNNFAISMIKKLSNQVIKDKKNVVIEGTFRTYDAPANTLRQFKENGFKTHAHLVLCQKDVAKASTIERYYKMQKSGLPGRMVTNEKFSEMVKGLANSANKIKESGLVESFTMSARRKLKHLEPLYKTDNPNKPSTIINQELNRDITKKEKTFINDVNQYHEQQQFLKGIAKMTEKRQEKIQDKDKGMEIEK